MTTPNGASSALENTQVPVQLKLAAAWTSFMFLYIYVDYLALYKPGVIDDILAGVVWEFQISQAWATGALVLMAVPILMIVLSVILPARANRVANLVVASVYVPVSAFNAVGESWTFFYGLAVALEVIVLGLVLRLAWAWPRAVLPTSPGNEVGLVMAASNPTAWATAAGERGYEGLPGAAGAGAEGVARTSR